MESSVAQHAEVSPEQRREAILERLRGVPHLPALFEGAVDLRQREGHPARRYILGVAIREIRNRLPDLLDSIGQFERERIRDILTEQFARWSSEVRPQISNLGINNASPEVATIAVPLGLAIQIDQAFGELTALRARHLDHLVLWLKNRGTPGSDGDLALAAAALFKSNADEFVHVPITPHAVSEERILADWDAFEIALFAIIGRPTIRLAFADAELEYWNRGYD